MTELEKAARQALKVMKHASDCRYKRITQYASVCDCGVTEAKTALRRALEPAKETDFSRALRLHKEAFERLEQQPADEPVCDKDPRGCWSVRCQLGRVCKNTRPQPAALGIPDGSRDRDDPFRHVPQPAAQWVGLTEEEVAVLMMEAWGCASIAPRNAPNFARAIEAKLREKNGFKE